ncbi:MAG: thioredoxin [Bacteroidales bacterium]
MKGNFEQLIQSDVPVLVDFYAEWCQPCKIQSPVLQELAREESGRVRVIKIDVDKNPLIARRYQIQGVPTLMLFRKGQVLWRQSGVTPKQVLRKVLEEFLIR